jgi:hypothetical protein
MSTPFQQQQQLQLIRRRKALADALAGVAATVVSLWAFYPMDVIKTKLQAGGPSSTLKDGKNKSQQAFMQLLQGLFRGWGIKTLHASSSSFCYFYLYSWIVSWWTTSRPTKNGSNKLSPAVRLTLSAIAAMMNTMLTLPLDVLASQRQAAQVQESDSSDTKQVTHSSPARLLEEEETSRVESDSSDDEGDEELRLTLVEQQERQMEKIWNEVHPNSNATPNSSKSSGVLVDENGDVFYDSCSERNSSFDDEEEEEEKTDEYARSPHPLGSFTVTVTASSLTSSSSCQRKQEHHQQHKLLQLETSSTVWSESTTTEVSLAENDFCGDRSYPTQKANQFLLLEQVPQFWKGLVPSLLLCSNPSIHYTVFDMAKTHLLQSKTSSNANNNNLSMMESFCLGLFAKFCATMATYPLIRAKVMLMVTTTKNCKTTMLQALLELYRSDGVVRGWYKGCNMQLLHTVLKSALLMMIKEKIARTTHQLLVPPSSQAATTARR